MELLMCLLDRSIPLMFNADSMKDSNKNNIHIEVIGDKKNTLLEEKYWYHRLKLNRMKRKCGCHSIMDKVINLILKTTMLKYNCV